MCAHRLGLAAPAMFTVCGLFVQPEPFIADVAEALKQLDANGINLDFEPCQDAHPTCDAADGKNYGKFLNTFTLGLRAKGFTVSVDIASWR